MDCHYLFSFQAKGPSAKYSRVGRSAHRGRSRQYWEAKVFEDAPPEQLGKPEVQAQQDAQGGDHLHPVGGWRGEKPRSDRQSQISRRKNSEGKECFHKKWHPLFNLKNCMRQQTLKKICSKFQKKNLFTAKHTTQHHLLRGKFVFNYFNCDRSNYIRIFEAYPVFKC